MTATSWLPFDVADAPPAPVTALTRTRVGGFCYYGQTGIGWLGPDHCWRCTVAVAEACRRFDAAVARGEYDAEGYTPKDRRAQAKRRT